MEIAETRQSSTVLFQNSKIIKPSWAYPRDLRPAQQHELTTQSGPSKRHPLTKQQKGQAQAHLSVAIISLTESQLPPRRASVVSLRRLHSTPRHATGGASGKHCHGGRRHAGGREQEEGRASAGLVAHARRLPPPRLRLVRLLRHLGAPRRRLLPGGE